MEEVTAKTVYELKKYLSVTWSFECNNYLALDD